MKLILAIVHDEDGSKVVSELNKQGFSVTKLATTGGFFEGGQHDAFGRNERAERTDGCRYH